MLKIILIIWFQRKYLILKNVVIRKKHEKPDVTENFSIWKTFTWVKEKIVPIKNFVQLQKFAPSNFL